MPDGRIGMPGVADKSLLRFLTCGSVDDGKSTLIGRLLYDADLIMGDQLAALKEESRRFGTTAGEIDFSLLLDGLEAERQQHITIDVAYRFFSTPRRSFIVADTPGHEQYTRNMACGASTADLALLLVDARKGVVATIAGEFGRFAASLGEIAVTAIPISARFGDNVTARSAHAPWYQGLTL